MGSIAQPPQPFPVSTGEDDLVRSRCATENKGVRRPRPPPLPWAYPAGEGNLVVANERGVR